MLLLDSDILIDLFRDYAPAIAWFSQLELNETVAVSGYTVLELIRGCRNAEELKRLRSTLAPHDVLWPSPADCDRAVETYATYRLSHNAGLLDVLIGHTAVGLNLPLHTFNQRHYAYIPELQTIQPYAKTVS